MDNWYVDDNEAAAYLLLMCNSFLFSCRKQAAKLERTVPSEFKMWALSDGPLGTRTSRTRKQRTRRTLLPPHVHI